MVDIGTLFRSQSEGAYGRPSRTVWRVIAINDAAGRYAHVSLADTADPLSTKMVAVNASLDPDLYLPVE
jgi:hypothetical protein